MSVAVNMAQCPIFFLLWACLTGHTTTQVTDYIPFNDLEQYRLLANCPKTLMDRVANEQFSSLLCDSKRRTAECVCMTADYPVARSEVASKISSVVDTGCEDSVDASRAWTVFYSWCSTNDAESIAASYGITVQTGSSSGMYMYTPSPPCSGICSLRLIDPM